MDERLLKIYRIAATLRSITTLRTFDRLIDCFIANPTEKELDRLEAAVKAMTRNERRPILVKV